MSELIIRSKTKSIRGQSIRFNAAGSKNFIYVNIVAMQTVIQEKFTIIDSTHTYALQKNNIQDNTLYVIQAQEQTAGIGRRQSKWQSPKGNLYISFILKSTALVELENQMLAYIILKVLKGYDIQTQFKWPNDLLYKGKKICGILSQKSGDMLVLSFGLNVNTNIENRASMSEVKGKIFDLVKIQTTIIKELQKERQRGFCPSFISELRKYLAYKNQVITYELDKKIFSAKLLDLAQDASLIVEVGGRREKIRCACNIRCG